MTRKKISFTTRYVLAFGLLMLAANLVLAFIILYQSEEALKSLVNKNMLDVVRSAADLLDGDALAALTKEDVDGEVFRDIAKRMIVFQNHEDIRYIYAVRKVGDNRFVFTVDPDPKDPGIFDALKMEVDGKPMEPGKYIRHAGSPRNYYSAYCPVFGSDGKVAGIVGIDFDADWYKARIKEHTMSIAIVTFLSVLIGGVVVFLITHNVRKRFRSLHTELSGLSSSLDQLILDAGGVSGNSDDSQTDSAEDEMGKLSEKIQMMRKDIAFYERIQNDRYYKDAVTGIPNLAYIKQYADIKADDLWAAQETPAVIYFDIRSMVSYNNEYGYDRGDELLKLTADSIRSAFPDAMVGRWEGDHFIVIDRYDDSIEQKAVQINDTVKRKAYGSTTGIQCAFVRMQPGMKTAEGIQSARNTLKKIPYILSAVLSTVI